MAELIACAGFVEIFRIGGSLEVFVVSGVGFGIRNSFYIFCGGYFEAFWRGTWCAKDRGEQKCGGEEVLEFHGDGDEAEVVTVLLHLPIHKRRLCRNRSEGEVEFV